VVIRRYGWLRFGLIVLMPLACSGGRKRTRDDAAAKPATGSDTTGPEMERTSERSERGPDAVGHDAVLGAGTAQGSNAVATGHGTVSVVVHWPKPPPVAFVAAPPCLGTDDVTPILTTTRLVVGAVVQLDGTASAIRDGRPSVLFAVNDCVIRPAVALATPKDSVQLRSNGRISMVAMQHLETVADRRRVQFPMIGHTVEVSDLALGMYQIAADNAAVAAATLVVTDQAAAISNGDGRVQFTAAPGAHRITAYLPAAGLRAAVRAELNVQVIAGEEVAADLNFGAP
jgi:hypothetical protein